MRRALREAQKADSEGEVPVGAVVVHDEKIIARAHNRPLGLSDPSAHAEVLALRRAAKKLGNYRLKGCDLYVTIEPCAMCAGAIIQARLRRLVYGTSDPKAGACGSALAVLNHPKVNHQVEVVSGVLAEECARDSARRSFAEGEERLRRIAQENRRAVILRSPDLIGTTKDLSVVLDSSTSRLSTPRLCRRGTEAVITGAPRKRLACQKRARGFESHPLRQKTS